jgi:hypothetical protein
MIIYLYDCFYFKKKEKKYKKEDIKERGKRGVELEILGV